MMDLQPDPKQRQRLLLAMALSALILLFSDFLSTRLVGRHVWSSSAQAQAAPARAEVAPVSTIVAPVAAAAVRLPLENDRVSAGYNLVGGKLDRLVLTRFAGDAGKAGFPLLSDEGVGMEYVESGWVGQGLQGPDAQATWQAEPDMNGPGKSLTLVWRNGSGQSFLRTVALKPGSYVVDVSDRVMNTAALPVTFTHYAQVQKADGYGEYDQSNWVNYYGPMGLVANGKQRLVEESFNDLKGKAQTDVVTGREGWWGITGQYFMSAIVPLDGETVRNFRHAVQGGRDFYTATVQKTVVVPAGGQAEVKYQVYVGPKAYSELRMADHQLEQAISWGWFEPIVKAFYAALVWLHGVLGNWGLAIIALTFGLKVLTYPLSSKSYRSMAKMKKLQPRIDALKERLKDDQQAFALEMMKLYQKEKVSPLGGCWPMLIQIPIFFSIYKVVLIGFELRQAPLGLWVHDLSLKDPYYILPVLMGISMYVQQKFQPPAADPTQAAVFKWMPVMFTFMFLNFPAGLVLYWLTNNLLSIAQQWVVTKRAENL